MRHPLSVYFQKKNSEIKVISAYLPYSVSKMCLFNEFLNISHIISRNLSVFIDTSHILCYNKYSYKRAVSANGRMTVSADN